MNYKKIIICVLILCLFLIPIVNAETLTGVLGSSGSINSTTYDAPNVGGGANQLRGLQFKDVEKIQGLTALIGFEKTAYTYDANAPNGATANFILYLAKSSADFSPSITDTTIKGTGTIGYQRYFNGATPPVEQPGYVWMTISGFNNTGLSGTEYFSLSYNHNALYNMTELNVCQPANIPTGTGVFIHAAANNGTAGGMPALYTMNKESNFVHYWSATKPSGIGISGEVGKNSFNSRVFISNSSNVPVTSDNLFNSVNFTFNVPSQAIYISVLDTYGTWYNTTKIFSETIPIPTPTSNPYYTGYYNLTVYAKNGVNNTPISNAYIVLNINPASSSNPTVQGYTDSNGAILFGLVQDNPNQKIEGWKTGYQYASSVFTSTHQSEMFLILQMYPDIGGNPSTPSTTNITLRVKDTNGNTPISSAYVTIRDTITGIAEQAQLTNSTGYVYFPNFPNTAYIDGIISKSGYTSLNWHIGYLPTEPNLYLERYITSAIPTVTPTPISYDTWSLGVNPNSIILGNSATLTTDCSNNTKEVYPTARMVLYYENDNLGAYSYNVLIGSYLYNTTTSKWNFKFPNNTWDYATAYNPMVLSVTPTTTGTYTYTSVIIGAGNFPFTTGTTIGTTSGNLLISSGAGGTLVMRLSALDGQTMSILDDVTLTLLDEISGFSNTWNNVSYDKPVALPRGREYKLTGIKAGYDSNSKYFTVPTDLECINGNYCTYVNVLLFHEGSISGNTSLSVFVSDEEFYTAIPNAKIQVTGMLPKYTGNSGEATFFYIPHNTNLTVTASKEGYCSKGTVVNVGTLPTKFIEISLKYGGCSGVTPTHTPIPGSTINATPSQTPVNIGNWGNGTAQVCGVLPVNATIIDQIKNSIACSGVTDKSGQDIFLAILIIIGCGLIAASKAKGIGFAIGSILGAGASLVMGLIPFWLIVVIVIACVAVIAVMIGKSGSG